MTGVFNIIGMVKLAEGVEGTTVTFYIPSWMGEGFQIQLIENYGFCFYYGVSLLKKRFLESEL